jgi:hypothetical protein
MLSADNNLFFSIFHLDEFYFILLTYCNLQYNAKTEVVIVVNASCVPYRKIIVFLTNIIFVGSFGQADESPFY